MNRIVLFLLFILLIISLITCQGYYSYWVAGYIYVEGTRQPIENVSVRAADYDLRQFDSATYFSDTWGEASITDSTGGYHHEMSGPAPVPCLGGPSNSPINYQGVYFRIEAEGFLALDTFFSGEEIQSGHMGGDSYQVPPLSLISDSSSI